MSTEFSATNIKTTPLTNTEPINSLSFAVPTDEWYSNTFQLEPFPSKRPSNNEIKNLVIDYYEAVAASYDSSSLLAPELCHYISTLDLLAQRALLDSLKKSENQKITPIQILSITSGSGRREELLVKKHRANVLDIIISTASKQMCLNANKKGFKTIPGYWQDIPNKFLITGFDLILALGNSEHWPSCGDANNFLRNAYAALLPGGALLIDFYNIDDPKGWGPKIEKQYTENCLENCGFEHGEYFYRRVDLPQLSYSRYFTFSQILTLIMGNGFETVWLKRVNQGSGEILNSSSDGNFVLFLRKPSL